jgi:hypothetical protein
MFFNFKDGSHGRKDDDLLSRAKETPKIVPCKSWNWKGMSRKNRQREKLISMMKRLEEKLGADDKKPLSVFQIMTGHQMEPSSTC